MIPIRLADKIVTVEKNSSLAELLTQNNYTNKGYAVALNGQFIPMTRHQSTLLQENDRIDIIAPMQGG